MSKHAIIVVDLGYGDSGKGSIVDALTERYRAHTVVRYNGGAQAAHTVVTPKGTTHTFAQWGSGTFHKDVHTYLSEYMLVDPLALKREEMHLRKVGISDGYERMHIDERALLITPFARALNRLREHARGDARHGSCGMGIGETVSDAIDEGENALRAGDMRDSVLLEHKLRKQRVRMHRAALEVLQGIPTEGAIVDEWELLAAEKDHAITNIVTECLFVSAKAQIVGTEYALQMLQKDGVVIFEGAQGVLIDQNAGFTPYTTWSDTTTKNAKTILEEHDWKGETTVLGVLRSYATRHGPGPFVSEDDVLSRSLPDPYNGWNEWQRDFRVGWFDAVASRYALAATGGVDVVAITNLDRLRGLLEWAVVTGYRMEDTHTTEIDSIAVSGEQRTRVLFSARPVLKTMKNLGDNSEFIRLIERELGVSVAITGYGPSYDSKEWRSEITAP